MKFEGVQCPNQTNHSLKTLQSSARGFSLRTLLSSAQGCSLTAFLSSSNNVWLGAPRHSSVYVDCLVDKVCMRAPRPEVEICVPGLFGPDWNCW